MTMRRYYVRVRACVAREDEDAKFRIDEQMAAIGERRTRWGSAAAAGRMRGEHVEIRHRRELSTMAARDDTRTELGRRQQRKKDKWCDCAKHRILTIQESA